MVLPIYPLFKLYFSTFHQLHFSTHPVCEILFLPGKPTEPILLDVHASLIVAVENMNE